jgi:hypothetical protein
MAFTDVDETEEEISEQPQDEGGEGGDGDSNRTFITIAAILGGITLVALLCTAVYAFIYLPQQRADKENAAATAYAQETVLAYEATQAAFVPPPTFTEKPASIEAVATATPVLAEGEPVNTATPTPDNVRATQGALDTVVAAAQTLAPTATRLPEGGFADDVGAPALLAMAVVLVVVIFLVRRLRTS